MSVRWRILLAVCLLIVSGSVSILSRARIVHLETRSLGSFRSIHHAPVRTPPPPANAFKPLISILTSVYKSDEYLEGFLVDITNQTYFGKAELLLGVVGEASPYVEELLGNFTHRFNNIVRIDYDDEKMKLYELWNDLIRHYARAPYITNANLDDRRHPESLELCSRFLDTHPDFDLVATATRTTTEKNRNWFTVEQYQDWWKDDNGYEITMRHMFKFDERNQIRDSNNIPHNAPMWRRSMHRINGYFDSIFDPVSDWEFWLRCLHGGSRMWLLNHTLNLYYINPNSHNRRNHYEQKLEMIRQKYGHYV